MKKNIIFVLALSMLLPTAAAGQNLDPTVEVRRAYEGKLMEVHKPSLDMAVPDSVRRFDLDFDYSVSETPYRGAYDFNPYAVNMKPSPKVYDRDVFYLRAGAGYQLHPVFDMVWSPKFKKPFRMNVYASHRSFVGDYWKMSQPVQDGNMEVIDRIPGSKEWGYDLFTKAGVDGRYDWAKALFRFDVNWQGIQQKDAAERSYYVIEAKAGVESKSQNEVLYRINAEYFFSEDNLYGARRSYQRTAGYDVNASLGYALKQGGRIGFDMRVRMANMTGAFDIHGNDFDFRPHYLLHKGSWILDLGLRVSVAGSSGGLKTKYEIASQPVYPDVKIGFMAIKNAMKIYLNVTGDSQLNTYSDLVGDDHRVNMLYGRGLCNLVDVSAEDVVTLGFDGRIGTRFSYDLRGGYAYVANALRDGVMVSGETPDGWLPSLGYGGYEKAFAALDWCLDTESLKFDGAVEYTYAWDNDKAEGLFLPAAVTGQTSLTYDWRDRIFVGMDCEFSTARYASLASDSVEIPGYADLGVNLGYAVNRKFNVWLRGGNLIGMTIQRSLLYAEKGPYFTAGITLNL